MGTLTGTLAVILIAVAAPVRAFDIPYPPRLPLSEPPAVCQALTPPQASRHVIRSGRGAWQAYVVETSSANYEVGVHLSRVRYVQTADKRFRTRENLGVGSTLADVRRVVRDELSYDPGWGYYVALPSGWSAALAPSDKKPGKRARIEWFFMRGLCSD
jgi:hypothetical protein